MKTLISIFVGVFAAATVANAKVLEFNIVKAEFSPAHVQNAGNGNLTLDYGKKKVTLFVQQNSFCPKDRYCAMVMPAPLQVELPIVNITTDKCGIRKITAKKDMRPVDGALEVITVLDPSSMTCPTFVAVSPTASYRTEYVNRLTGKSVVDLSKMVLSLNSALNDAEVLETSLAPAILIKYVRYSGFSPKPSVTTFYIDKIGRVIRSVKQLNTDKVVTETVAQLNPIDLNDLRKMIATIPANAELIDENAGEPRCTDAPSSELTVSVKSKDVAIYAFQSCHTFTAQVGASESLYKLMMTYVNAAK